jgi:hypothetical protein
VITKVLTFEGYDGKQYAEEYCFHMTKAALAEMKSYLEETGLDEYLAKISASSKASEVLPHFKDIIRKSIGRMSEDGRRFIQGDEIWNEFTQTPAYDEFFIWLLENPTEAAQFFMGILPKDMQAEVAAKQAQMSLPLPNDEPQDTPPKTRFQDYTRKELLEMPAEQYEALVGTDLAKMSKPELQITTQRLALEKQAKARIKTA